MNKMKKLLSVVLAVVLAFSALSVLGSAAKANYQTIADLEKLEAYSPYGQVTRLSTEERMSIVFDALDTLLAGANINPGTLFSLLGLSLTIDLRSVDAICGTLDNVKDLLGNWLVGLAGGALGIVGDLNLDSWTAGRRRSGAQLDIVKELLAVLNDNKGIVYDVISTGNIDLGLASSALGSLDLSIIADIPGLIKGLVFPLLERWDDPLSLIKTYDTNSKGSGKVEETVNDRVKKLFTDNMSITTVKYDADGNMTSEHEGMPFRTSAPGTPAASDPRCVYVISGTTPGSTLKIYHIVDAEEAKASEETDKVLTAYTYVEQEETYYLEQEVEGSATYVWKSTDELGNVTTLKYYNDDSQFLKGFDASNIKLSDANVSAGDLLYTFIPVVFDKLATVVLNGSVKKALAGFFGAEFKHIGKAGTDDVVGLGNDPIFAEEQGEYVFEWSDYAIVDGVHYYRYLDDVYVADLSATNNYFDVIDWNFEITGDFMNQFVPSSDDSANDRLLLKLNDFLVKVANTVLVDSVMTEDSVSGETAQWTKPAFVSGDNSNLINNIKALAQTFVKLAPQHIFGSDYETNPRCYYDLLVSTDNDTVLTGIAAQLVDILMPSMTLPAADDILDSGAKVGAILAAAVREFAAYLVPEYNFDALIYTSFENGEKKFVNGKGIDSEYWFDVILTMGINIGFEYLRAFADMGEGTELWNSFVAYSGYAPEGKTYPAGMTTAELNAHWEGMLDYVVDWALWDGVVTETVTEIIPGKPAEGCTPATPDEEVTHEKTYCKYEWTWKMQNLVKTDGLTIDLATAQDPFVKIQQILGSILPVDEILTVEPAEGETKFEHWLRHDLILGIVDLKWDHLINTIQFDGPNKYFRSGNVLDQLAKLVKGIVNSLFAKVGGGSYALLPSAMTDFDSLANQGNLAVMVRDLLGALNTAYSRGLLDTVLPILNMFIGWKMDPQVIADPTIWATLNNDKDYAYQTGTTISGTTISFLNNSSGMLEIHRNSTVEDHEYAIQINSVTSDATVNTLKFDYGDGYCSPYETLNINVSGTYKGEEAATITIAYSYLGKDGTAIGGPQYTSITLLFSNQAEDADISGRWSGDDDKDYTGTDDFGRYQFTEDIYDTVVNYQARIFYVGATTSNPSKSLGTIAAPDWDDKNGERVYYPMTGLADTYFAFRAADADAGWKKTMTKDSGDSYGYLYKAKSDVTADTEFPYGVYDMGRIAVAYGSDNKTYEIEFIHYNDYDIYDIYTENQWNGYNANQGVDAATYNEYNAAWKDIVKYATYPMMTEANGHADTDYVKTIQPYIPAAIERFEAAKEAYELALAEAQATGAADSELPTHVEALKAEIDNDFAFGKEINFQDYEYYEYFNYNDVKVAAEEVYRSYLAPEIMDTYYIMGSGIREAELNEVVAAEGNPFIAAGILASRMENDKEAIDASIAANAEWKQPTHTKLYVEDFTSRLGFYKQFLAMNATRENADHMYFLNKEIAFVEAQNLKEADYEAVTWGRYADALAEAKAVAAGTDEFSSFNSRIYDVKYNLMVAYKQLLLKDNSLIEAGGTGDLLANIEVANKVFAGLADGTWQVKDGVEADAAYAELISALGYYYEGEDGNRYNLYADSALEYADNDRPNKQANQAKVNAANDTLALAIANFEEAEEPAGDPELILTEYGEEMGAVINENLCTSYYDGAIYGVDTIEGEALEDYFTTEFGYVVFVENEENDVFSTGATAELYNDDDELIATYVFIYFGDVNGDEVVDISDASEVEAHDQYVIEIEEDTAMFYAADVNFDGVVDISDASEIEAHDQYVAEILSQAEIAAGITEAY